jgi:7-cyano-7-deazaguanine synthase
MTTKKAVCLLSGGLDSTTLLFYLKEIGYDVLALSIGYGQRHMKELAAAQLIAREAQTPILQMNLSLLKVLMKGSSQTSPEIPVPEGHYSADNMAITVVPNRNMILLSLATAWAISERADLVAYAAHIGDHDQYPDCRKVFIDAMSEAIKLCDNNPPDLIAPFSHLTKATIVGLAKTLKIPFHLTYSCYNGEEKHCGRCGTCVERAEAFWLAQVKDPTEYQDPDYWKAVTKTK